MKKMKWLGVMAFVASFALASCLNPIGFNPDALKIATDASGSEIGIDNINNAELRFVNHTKSMDIVDVEILVDGETKAGRFYSYGDSRIAGGPHAGTSEAILERPTGTNGSGSIKVTGYKVAISYQKAAKSKLSDAELNGLDTQSGTIVFTIGDYARTQGDKWGVSAQVKKLADNLLRGKQIVHFYRDKNGGLQVSVGEPGASEKDTMDFVQSMEIINSTHIDLGNLELGVNIKNSNPIEVTFSPEVMQAIGDLHIKLDDLTRALQGISGAINQQTATIAKIGDVMNQMIVTGNGGVSPNYSLLIVQNHTGEEVKDLDFVNKSLLSNTGMPGNAFIGLIEPESQDYVVIRNGGWDVAGNIGLRAIKTTVIAPQQRYVHIYRSTTGAFKVVSTEKDWLAARPEDALKEYGYLTVRNDTDRKIESVYFVKKYGSGNAADYDFTNKGSIQWVSPYGAIKSELRLETGNYAVFASLDDGSLLFSGTGRDVPVYAQENANDSTRNVVIIRPEDVQTIVPPKITYYAYTNGGPGAASSDTEDAYQTDTMTLSFSANVTTAPRILISGTVKSVFGTPVQSASDPRLWEVPVTANASERVTFTLTHNDIVDTPYQVNVFKKNAAPPPVSFTPVTDVVVLNGEDFVTGQGKQIVSSIAPANANNRHITWSIDLGDTANFAIKKMYGLGASYDLSMSDSGHFRVSSGWQHSYWYVAAIVENGKAPGQRAPIQQGIAGTFTDPVTGAQVNGSMLSILYDANTDFVKLFRFNRYIAPTVPQYVNMTFVNRDDGWNAAMTRLIAYRLRDDVNIGTSADVKNGNPHGLNFNIYRTGGGGSPSHQHTDLNVVMGIRYPTSGDNAGKGVAVENKNVADLPKYLVNIEESNVISINGDASKATTDGYVYIHESALLEFDRPMDRQVGNKFFIPNPTSVQIRFDGTGNWLLAWIGSNQFTTKDVYRSGGPGTQAPTAQTGNGSKYWVRGGNNNGNGDIWFILPPALRGMKTNDSITVYARTYGIRY